MAKYKIEVTGDPTALTFDFSIDRARLWIRSSRATDVRIISVAGVPVEEIPDWYNTTGHLGRSTLPLMSGNIHSVAVRPDLTRYDFEITVI